MSIVFSLFPELVCEDKHAYTFFTFFFCGQEALFYPQYTLALIYMCNGTTICCFLRILHDHNQLKFMFLAYADTDLSLLDIVFSREGNQLSSYEFCKAYSDYSLSQSLPRNSYLLTLRYERTYSYTPSTNKTPIVFSGTESRYPMCFFFPPKTSSLKLLCWK